MIPCLLPAGRARGQQGQETFHTSKEIQNPYFSKNLYYDQGSHAVLKVLNFKIDFQDLEIVLNLAKMCIRC